MNSGFQGRWLKYIFFSTLITIAFQLMSCDPSLLPPPSIEDGSFGLLPLKVGNSWEYRWEKYKRDSTKIDERKFKIDVSERSFDPKNKFINPVYGCRNAFFDNNEWKLTSGTVYFYRNFEDGLYIMGGKEPMASVNAPDTLYTKVLYLKYPVEKGEKWKSPGLLIPFSFPIYEQYLLNDTTTYTCLGTNVKIETSIGLFSCIIYHHIYKPQNDVDLILEIYEYYSPEAGLIEVITNQRRNLDVKNYPYSKQIIITKNFTSNINN